VPEEDADLVRMVMNTVEGKKEACFAEWQASEEQIDRHVTLEEFSRRGKISSCLFAPVF
jgi:hypothetical protein